MEAVIMLHSISSQVGTDGIKPPYKPDASASSFEQFLLDAARETPEETVREVQTETAEVSKEEVSRDAGSDMQKTETASSDENLEQQEDVKRKYHATDEAEQKGKDRKEDITTTEGKGNEKSLVHPKIENDKEEKNQVSRSEEASADRKKHLVEIAASTEKTDDGELKKVNDEISGSEKGTEEQKDESRQKTNLSFISPKDKESPKNNGTNGVLRNRGESAQVKTIVFDMTEKKGKSSNGKKNGTVKGQDADTADNKKKFFFIDQRTARDKADTASLKTVDAGEKTGKENRTRAGGEVQQQFVKEEIFDNSEKIFKLPSDVQNRQVVQQQSDTFGQKHTQSAQLQRHLAELGNKQIVKQTGIILKNDNSGEIRLVLKPENLGKVRIQLQMQDNAITGKILVDNSAVKSAFDQNMEALYKAFKESGFETAQLDVQVGGERSGENSENSEAGSGMNLRHIKVMEEQIPLSGVEKTADTLIDLVV